MVCVHPLANQVWREKIMERTRRDFVPCSANQERICAFQCQALMTDSFFVLPHFHSSVLTGLSDRAEAAEEVSGHSFSLTFVYFAFESFTCWTQRNGTPFRSGLHPLIRVGESRQKMPCRLPCISLLCCPTQQLRKDQVRCHYTTAHLNPLTVRREQSLSWFAFILLLIYHRINNDLHYATSKTAQKQGEVQGNVQAEESGQQVSRDSPCGGRGTT
jgi:hypothetical protein